MPREEYALDLSGGENTFFAPRVLPPNQFPIYENVDVYRTYGHLYSRPGRTVFLEDRVPSLGNRVNGYAEFKQSDGTTIHVVAAGEDVFDVTPAPGSTHASRKGTLVMTDARTSFVQFQNALYMANPGGRIAKKVGSGNFAALADTNAPSNSQILELWRGKLWAVQDGRRIRCSATDAPDDWTTTGDATFFDVEPQDGSDILALIPYSEGMLIAKRHKLYEMTGVQFSNFSYREVRREGIVGPRAWAVWDRLPIVATPSGIWYLGGQVTRESNLALRFLREYRDQIAQSSSVALGVNRDVLFVAWDSDGDGAPDRAKVIDIPTGRCSTWTNQPAHFYHTMQDGTLLAGTGDNRAAMLKMLQGSSDEGAAIAVKFRTKAFSISEVPMLRGSVDEVRVLARRTATTRTATLRLVRNDSASLITTLGSSMDLTASGGVTAYEIFSRGSMNVSDCVTFAIEFESSGTNELEVGGIAVHGGEAEGP